MPLKDALRMDYMGPDDLIGAPMFDFIDGEPEENPLKTQELYRDLYNTDISVKIKAIRGLGQIGGDKVIKWLIALIFDQNSQVRQTVEASLVNLGVPNRSAMLKRALTMENKDIRIRAETEILAQGVTKEALAGGYLKILITPGDQRRIYAAEGLGRLQVKNEEIKNALMACLFENDEDLRVASEQSLLVLGIPKEELTAIYNNTLKDQNAGRRMIARDGLSRLEGFPGGFTLLELLGVIAGIMLISLFFVPVTIEHWGIISSGLSQFFASIMPSAPPGLILLFGLCSILISNFVIRKIKTFFNPISSLDNLSLIPNESLISSEAEVKSVYLDPDSTVAVEVHHGGFYGIYIRTNQRIVGFSKGVVLAYPSSFNKGEVIDTDEYRVVSSNSGEIPDYVFDDWPVKNNSIDVIISGELWEDCHLTAFKDVLKWQKRSGVRTAYHFIGKQIRGFDSDVDLSELFSMFNSQNIIEGNLYYDAVRNLLTGNRVSIYLDGRLLFADSPDASEIKIYYWTNRITFERGISVMPSLDDTSAESQEGNHCDARGSLMFGIFAIFAGRLSGGVFLIRQALNIFIAFIKAYGLIRGPTYAISGRAIAALSFQDPAFDHLPPEFQESIEKIHEPAHLKGASEKEAYLAQAQRSNGETVIAGELLEDTLKRLTFTRIDFSGWASKVYSHPAVDFVAKKRKTRLESRLEHFIFRPFLILRPLFYPYKALNLILKGQWGELLLKARRVVTVSKMSENEVLDRLNGSCPDLIAETFMLKDAQMRVLTWAGSRIKRFTDLEIQRKYRNLRTYINYLILQGDVQGACEVCDQVIALILEFQKRGLIISDTKLANFGIIPSESKIALIDLHAVGFDLKEFLTSARPFQRDVYYLRKISPVVAKYFLIKLQENFPAYTSEERIKFFNDGKPKPNSDFTCTMDGEPFPVSVAACLNQEGTNSLLAGIVFGNRVKISPASLSDLSLLTKGFFSLNRVLTQAQICTIPQEYFSQAEDFFEKRLWAFNFKYDGAEHIVLNPILFAMDNSALEVKVNSQLQLRLYRALLHEAAAIVLKESGLEYEYIHQISCQAENLANVNLPEESREGLREFFEEDRAYNILTEMRIEEGQIIFTFSIANSGYSSVFRITREEFEKLFYLRRRSLAVTENGRNIPQDENILQSFVVRVLDSVICYFSAAYAFTAIMQAGSNRLDSVVLGDPFKPGASFYFSTKVFFNDRDIRLVFPEYFGVWNRKAGSLRWSPFIDTGFVNMDAQELFACYTLLPFFLASDRDFFLKWYESSPYPFLSEYSLPETFALGKGIYTSLGQMDDLAQDKTAETLSQASTQGRIISWSGLPADVRNYIETSNPSLAEILKQKEFRFVLDDSDIHAASPPYLWYESPKRFLLAVTTDILENKSLIYLPINLIIQLIKTNPELFTQIVNHELNHLIGQKENIFEAEGLAGEVMISLEESMAVDRCHGWQAEVYIGQNWVLKKPRGYFSIFCHVSSEAKGMAKFINKYFQDTLQDSGIFAAVLFIFYLGLSLVMVFPRLGMNFSRLQTASLRLQGDILSYEVMNLGQNFVIVQERSDSSVGSYLNSLKHTQRFTQAAEDYLERNFLFHISLWRRGLSSLDYNFVDNYVIDENDKLILLDTGMVTDRYPCQLDRPWFKTYVNFIIAREIWRLVSHRPKAEILYRQLVSKNRELVEKYLKGSIASEIWNQDYPSVSSNIKCIKEEPRISVQILSHSNNPENSLVFADFDQTLILQNSPVIWSIQKVREILRKRGYLVTLYLMFKTIRNLLPYYLKTDLACAFGIYSSSSRSLINSTACRLKLNEKFIKLARRIKSERNVDCLEVVIISRNTRQLVISFLSRQDVGQRLEEEGIIIRYVIANNGEDNPLVENSVAKTRFILPGSIYITDKKEKELSGENIIREEGYCVYGLLCFRKIVNDIGAGQENRGGKLYDLGAGLFLTASFYFILPLILKIIAGIIISCILITLIMKLYRNYFGSISKEKAPVYADPSVEEAFWVQFEFFRLQAEEAAIGEELEDLLYDTFLPLKNSCFISIDTVESLLRIRQADIYRIIARIHERFFVSIILNNDLKLYIKIKDTKCPSYGFCFDITRCLSNALNRLALVHETIKIPLPSGIVIHEYIRMIGSDDKPIAIDFASVMFISSNQNTVIVENAEIYEDKICAAITEWAKHNNITDEESISAAPDFYNLRMVYLKALQDELDEFDGNVRSQWYLHRKVYSPRFVEEKEFANANFDLTGLTLVLFIPKLFLGILFLGLSVWIPHELGHYIAAKALKTKAKFFIRNPFRRPFSIFNIFGIFGVDYDDSHMPVKQRILVSIAGPLVNGLVFLFLILFGDVLVFKNLLLIFHLYALIVNILPLTKGPIISDGAWILKCIKELKEEKKRQRSLDHSAQGASKEEVEAELARLKTLYPQEKYSHEWQLRNTDAVVGGESLFEEFFDGEKVSYGVIYSRAPPDSIYRAFWYYDDAGKIVIYLRDDATSNDVFHELLASLKKIKHEVNTEISSFGAISSTSLFYRREIYEEAVKHPHPVDFGLQLEAIDGLNIASALLFSHQKYQAVELDTLFIRLDSEAAFVTDFRRFYSFARSLPFCALTRVSNNGDHFSFVDDDNSRIVVRFTEHLFSKEQIFLRRLAENMVRYLRMKIFIILSAELAENDFSVFSGIYRNRDLLMEIMQMNGIDRLCMPDGKILPSEYWDFMVYFATFPVPKESGASFRDEINLIIAQRENSVGKASTDVATPGRSREKIKGSKFAPARKIIFEIAPPPIPATVKNIDYLKRSREIHSEIERMYQKVHRSVILDYYTIARGQRLITRVQTHIEYSMRMQEQLEGQRYAIPDELIPAYEGLILISSSMLFEMNRHAEYLSQMLDVLKRKETEKPRQPRAKLSAKEIKRIISDTLIFAALCFVAYYSRGSSPLAAKGIFCILLIFSFLNFSGALIVLTFWIFGKSAAQESAKLALVSINQNLFYSILGRFRGDDVGLVKGLLEQLGSGAAGYGKEKAKRKLDRALILFPRLREDIYNKAARCARYQFSPNLPEDMNYSFVYQIATIAAKIIRREVKTAGVKRQTIECCMYPGVQHRFYIARARQYPRLAGIMRLLTPDELCIDDAQRFLLYLDSLCTVCGNLRRYRQLQYRGLACEFNGSSWGFDNFRRRMWKEYSHLRIICKQEDPELLLWEIEGGILEVLGLPKPQDSNSSHPLDHSSTGATKEEVETELARLRTVNPGVWEDLRNVSVVLEGIRLYEELTEKKFNSSAAGIHFLRAPPEAKYPAFWMYNEDGSITIYLTNTAVSSDILHELLAYLERTDHQTNVILSNLKLPLTVRKNIYSQAKQFPYSEPVDFAKKFVYGDENERKICVLMNKPVGYVSQRGKDTLGRPNVYQLLPPQIVKCDINPRGATAVGRLDADTDGLLIFTNIGGLHKKLTLPNSGIQKRYLVKVSGFIRNEEIRKLEGGVTIMIPQEPRRGGKRKTGNHHLIEYLTQPAVVELKSRSNNFSVFEIVISEGKNRQIRRMCEAVGHPVLSLTRIKIGFLELDGLEPGQWRHLTAGELEELKMFRSNSSRDFACSDRPMTMQEAFDFSSILYRNNSCIASAVSEYFTLGSVYELERQQAQSLITRFVSFSGHALRILKGTVIINAPPELEAAVYAFEEACRAKGNPIIINAINLHFEGSNVIVILPSRNQNKLQLLKSLIHETFALTFVDPPKQVSLAHIHEIASNAEKIAYQDISDSGSNQSFKDSLTDTFGISGVKKVFDFAAGDGQWLRMVLSAPWISDHLEAVGFDLIQPQDYGTGKIDTAESWQGLNIISSREDEGYPEDGSIDLYHEAFLDTDYAKSSSKGDHLECVDSVVAPEGWFIFVHKDELLDRSYYISWLLEKGYEFRVYGSRNENIPRDYPETFWFRQFWGHQGRNIYLILAKKTQGSKVAAEDKP